LEKKPLSRLERIKADQEKFAFPPAKKTEPVKAKPGLPVPAKKRKIEISDRSIEAIAKALSLMMKE
jgi:hypothetical protein